jgi:hypothetical protein
MERYRKIKVNGKIIIGHNRQERIRTKAAKAINWRGAQLIFQLQIIADLGNI